MTTRKADWSKRTAKKTAGTTVALDDSIVVPATPAVAWTRLEDVPLVASCLPGLDPATLVAIGPNAFRARMSNTVMGMTANWDLKATIHPNVETRELNVVLEGADPRLNMRLNGVADVAVRADDLGQALLDYTANLRIDGSLAAMGGPVIRSILSDAIAQFVAVVGGQEPVESRSLPAWLRERLSVLWKRLTGKLRKLTVTKGNS
jgi:carbon monoxide dehydrogenase subunit G